MTVLVAGAATFLDAREVFYQFGRGNTLLASLALLVTLFHAVATIMAALGWQSLGPVQPPPIAA